MNTCYNIVTIKEGQDTRKPDRKNRKGKTKMKNVNEMNTSELMAEIKYMVSLFDDRPMALHCASYLAELAEALEKKAVEEMSE